MITLEIMLFDSFFADVRNYFALTYVSPLDARQRMLVFKLGAEIEKKDWLDQLVTLITESNCCPDTVGFLLFPHMAYGNVSPIEIIGGTLG